MFNGYKKAVTFSYDDGVTQDKRLVEIFNKYKLKATFNLNSHLLGTTGELERYGKKISHNKIEANEVPEIYLGHEVAVHTLTHPNLVDLDDGDIIYQVEQDRVNLSNICGYEVCGMAYPGGGVNNDERVAEVVKKTEIKYARTTVCTEGFSIQNDLLRFNPTVYHVDIDKMFELAERFLEAEPEEPMLYYIWGHSYELDALDLWEKFEEFCKLISGHKDVFYGTNSDVLLK